MTGVGRFKFLNEEYACLFPASWNDRSLSKLWLYNLHYFNDLVANDADHRREWHSELMHRWIKDNPPTKGAGWEPYPLSRRIVNWVKWMLHKNSPTKEILASLAVQARYLNKGIEHHILGNHLLANAKALIFVGLFLEGKEAERWLQKGIYLLEREVQEQICPDGGHFERSPMYHSIVLEDLLDLYNLATAYHEDLPRGFPGRHLVSRIPRMLSWLQTMSHPDGEISLFNDAAIGIASSPRELENYAFRLGFGQTLHGPEGITHLESTGFVRLQNAKATALLNVGDVGPDYLPGHAHADTLSFELSVFNQRVLVDTGTSCYHQGPQRELERSTAAHNTVVINGCDSSEVWEVFRVARRARTAGLAIRSSGDSHRVLCYHDGYQRLRGSPVHRREWILTPHNMVVADAVEGDFKEACTHFHFHPDVVVAPNKDGGQIHVMGKGIIALRVERGNFEWGWSKYHPEFGKAEQNMLLKVRFGANETRVTLQWQ